MLPGWSHAKTHAFTDPTTGWSYCTSCAGGAVVDTGGLPLLTGSPAPAHPARPRLQTLPSGRAPMSSIQSDSGCPPGEAQCVVNPRAYATQPPIGEATHISPVVLRNPSNVWLKENPENGCGCASCAAGDWCQSATPVTWIDEYAACNCMSCGAFIVNENPLKGFTVPVTDIYAWHVLQADIVLQAADGSDRLFPVEYTEAFVRQGEIWDPDVPVYKWQIWAQYAGTYQWLDRTEAEALAWVEADPDRKRREVVASYGGYVGDGQFYRTWPLVTLVGASTLVHAMKDLANSRGIETEGVPWNLWFVPTFDSLFIDIEGTRYPLTLNAGPCGMCPTMQAQPSSDDNPPSAKPGLVNISGDGWGKATGIDTYQRSKYKITEGDPLTTGVTVTESDFSGNVTVTKYNTAGQVVAQSYNDIPVAPGTPKVCLTEPDHPDCQPKVGAGANLWPTIAMVGGAAALAFFLLRRQR